MTALKEAWLRKPAVMLVCGTALLALATLIVLLYAAMQAQRFECEVCVVFHGRLACREAVGSSEAEATRTAIDTACSTIASGMTQIVSCGNTSPESTSCRER